MIVDGDYNEFFDVNSIISPAEFAIVKLSLPLFAPLDKWIVKLGGKGCPTISLTPRCIYELDAVLQDPQAAAAGLEPAAFTGVRQSMYAVFMAKFGDFWTNSIIELTAALLDPSQSYFVQDRIDAATLERCIDLVADDYMTLTTPPDQNVPDDDDSENSFDSYMVVGAQSTSMLVGSTRTIVKDEMTKVLTMFKIKGARYNEEYEQWDKTVRATVIEEFVKRYPKQDDAMVSRVKKLNVQPYALYKWEGLERKFPHVAVVVAELLAIPAASTESERIWSTGGRTVTKRRLRLAPDKVEDLMFVKAHAPGIDALEKFMALSEKLMEELSRRMAEIDDSDTSDDEENVVDDDAAPINTAGDASE